MPLKTLKRDTKDALTLEWLLHVKHYKLTLDKTRCVGCQICSLACPKEAIKLERQPKIQGQKAKKAVVDISLEKCNFCGVCDVSCPYGAIKLTLNGEHVLSVLDKESFPELIRDIKVDTRKCPKDCVECEKACPLSLIKISRIGYDGTPVEDVERLPLSQKKRVQINVEIQKEYCPTCRICEFKCAPGVLKVHKLIEGKIAIDQQKCPEGCTDCLDVCPITGALYLSEKDGKVHVNELFCLYCGACKAVCPVEDALTLKRTKINHTPVRSGTWIKALERLTSPVATVKELKARGSQKAKETVCRRFVLEERIR
ncbi:MAG: 4Fe-4S dicluster domain-containing protein [Candidatus Bathyarchaeota archaeon]|nr:4Fe-4S dicluster domain-containing protein [Candidatus Bathyarchaeota archaeon]